MSYKVGFNKRSKYLEAFVSGSRILHSEANDALHALGEIAEFAKESKLTKILIHWNILGSADRGQTLILMSNLEKYSWSKNYKTASVHLDPENFKSSEFAAIAAKELG